MYEKFYQLNQNPFSLTPDPQFVCMTAQHREALSGLIYSVCTRPGLTMLVGEVGTGKTTLLYTLLEFLEKKKYITGFCTNPMLTRDEFYDYLLNELEVPCTSTLKSQQLIALQTTLLKNRAAGRPAILIVDEAQRLSVDLLEEIRLLTNLETPREKLLQIIIAGQPELSGIFRRHELRQLKQRINYYCTLRPLGVEEVKEYIHHRLECAGLPNQILFQGEALAAVVQYSRGIPRLINTLCDNALQIGFAIQSPQITVSIVQEAAAGLELSPGPVAVSPQKELDKVRSQTISSPNTEAELVTVPSAALVAELGREAREMKASRVPLESFISRQKSYGLFGSLLGMWR